MRRTRSPCCARVAIGHTTAPPSKVMNVRRLIAAPEAQIKYRTAQTILFEGTPRQLRYVRFGSLADIQGRQR